MDIIQLLPDTVANQIAAGEVIERPASVIKELVENAIDADATVINVVVVDAGRTTIRVVDNGKGMSPTDARLAFEHHATSKIRKADDLFSLHTMGFRGEALATIAAVAQVELRTRQKDDDVGTQISIAGSKVQNQEVVSCPAGSNFAVNNIFYNIPARRKFLKSDAAELNQIVATFERIALVYPNITFTLHAGEVEKYNLRAGSQLQRIVDIFGHKMQQDLVPVNVETSVCNVSGFVGKPESAKKKGARQFFFVNGRYMKHPYFHKAVLMAVERMLPAGEQIPYFLYLNVNPEDIDVNVSPTKTEIKFENEQTIWQVISAAVKDSIGKFSDVPTIDFDSENRPDIPVFGSRQGSFSLEDFTPQPKSSGYNPFKATPSSSFPSLPKSKPAKEWSTLYDVLAPEPVMEEQPIDQGTGSHYQYKGMYIMTAVKSGLMVIDQHRAHLRVLYERFMKQLQQHNATSQKVLFPEIISFNSEEEAMLQKINEELASLGFDITPLGGGSYAINGMPGGLEAGIDATKILQEIVAAAVGSHGQFSTTDAINSLISERLAKHAAITYGEVLDEKEMQQLVADLFLCQNANYTPSGKLIVSIIDDVESRFK